MNNNIVIEKQLEGLILHHRGSADELVALVATKYPTAKWSPDEDDCPPEDCDLRFNLNADEFDAEVYYIVDNEGKFYVTEISVYENFLPAIDADLLYNFNQRAKVYHSAGKKADEAASALLKSIVEDFDGKIDLRKLRDYCNDSIVLSNYNDQDNPEYPAQVYSIFVNEKDGKLYAEIDTEDVAEECITTLDLVTMAEYIINVYDTLKEIEKEDE